tara:strand:- start:28717 stop:28899 length:183 start_codon:yes stop_codon:yes gene_type:complete
MKLAHKLFIVALMVTGFSAFAQPKPPSSNNPAPLPGLILLAAAGAAFGAKKVYDKKGSED